ncbi:MAG: ORF6N domain-containing protein [Elusimicrobiota bacterium]|nr:ORF6N domain-containing protein [Elusimicrobiota bacterium]
MQDVRGCKVLLDCHAAEYFEVELRVLHAAVKRHRSHFPADFMLVFQGDEAASLDRRLLASSRESRKLPALGFTAVGIDMLASVLKSKRAIEHSVANIREGFAALDRIRAIRQGV